MTDRLTASEAAARLGVKRATLYAYVSRGLLERTVALDGRTSLFDPDQVDALRSGRRRRAKGELSTVIASSITRLDEAGHEYRDRPVAELISAGLSFEDVADHIWLASHRSSDWVLPGHLARDVDRAQAAMPADTPSLDRLRVSVSVASARDGLRHALSPGSFVRAGRTMIGAMTRGLSAESDPEGSTAARLWPGLIAPRGGGQHDGLAPDRVRSLETALILLADHGLATSTFGVRLAASVRADPYSAVAAGLGSMGGVLHGSASDAVVRLLDRSNEVGAEAAVAERLDAGDRLPGFGRTIYRRADPRETILRSAVERGWSDDPRLVTVWDLRDLVVERTDQPPNIDLALGALSWLGGFGERAVSVFAVARTVGWVAHATEELGEQPVRFRPAARYVANRDDPDCPDLP